MAGIVRLAALLVLTATLVAAASAAGGVPLRPVMRVSLPGDAVRFDYVSIDQGTGRLWIAHMNAGELLVFDLHGRRVVHRVAAPGVHGVLAVSALHRVFASATDDHELLTLDARTGRVLHHAPAGDYPDGIAYDPVQRHVFVSDESGGIEAVFDARGRRIGTIDVGGEAGNVQYDAGSGRVLVDVQTRGDVAVIDPRTNRVVQRVPLPGCDHPHGLLIDASRRLAFVACDGNARLLTLDLETMKVTGAAIVGDSPDVLAFDKGRRRLYVSAESGTVAVFAEQRHALSRLGLGFVAAEAHSVAVDQRTHLVYFPLERGSEGRPELLIMAPS